ncbi:MAG: phosphonopyruvate decarboxylase [Bacteroidetes bacterium GWF2_40_14]|nr:MAG: phosphonopyruvate decarboxylase [Bacteroidetes bacterium GWF2_40_14]
MISPRQFYNLLIDKEVDFFAGVPDSLLKGFCAYITDNVSQKNNIIAANEGGAVALGAGYHLATGRIPLIYMQNSGIGNAINPLLSLIDNKVYSIPMILMIGWRGEPGIKDEPQHIKQGEVTAKLLDAMSIPYEILPDDYNKAKEVIRKSIYYVKLNNSPFAFIIRDNLFESYELQNKEKTDFEMNREVAIKTVVDSLEMDDIVVSTTGKASRELFEYRNQLNQGHEKDFLTVGSMGHASQIALGIALQKPDRQIYCFDGDGAAIMHTGSLGIIGSLAPKNFKHIILNNGAHDSVGGQPTIGTNLDFTRLAKVFNYKNVFFADNMLILKENILKLKSSEGPSLLEIKINKGARKDLGRPSTTPIENKIDFMKFLE